jgi:hypothetical protein
MSLQAIQSELKAPKGQKNTFGNYFYRSCEDILEAVKPLLLNHGMSLVLSDVIKEVAGVPQMVIVDESTKPKTKQLVTATMIYVEATATLHQDGKAIASATAQAGIDVNKAGMDFAQAFGASSSYARKYALNGLFCTDDTKDSDHTNQHDKSSQSSKPATPAKPYFSQHIAEDLKACKDIAELKKVFSALTKPEQVDHLDLKDKLKIEIVKKTMEAPL